MTMIGPMNTRRWHGLILGLIVVVMMHLTATTNAGRFEDPWPLLLSSEPADIDSDVASLHLRVNASLEKLMHSARAPEQPL